MSWFSGSQLTPRSSGEAATADGPRNASMFAETLACVSATPLGDEVEPEVNCTNAMSPSDGCRSGSPIGPSRSSAQSTSVRSGHTRRSSSNDGSSARLVTTARAPEARRIAAVSSRYRASSPVADGG